MELRVAEQEAPVIDTRTAARLALAKAHRKMLMDAASAHRLSDLSGEDTQAANADELEARFVTGADEVEACTTPIPRECSLSSDDSAQQSCTSMSTSRARQLCDKEVQVSLTYYVKDLKDGGTPRGASEEAEVFQHERMLFEKERQRWLDEKSVWEREMVDRDRRYACGVCVCVACVFQDVNRERILRVLLHAHVCVCMRASEASRERESEAGSAQRRD